MANNSVYAQMSIERLRSCVRQFEADFGASEARVAALRAVIAAENPQVSAAPAVSEVVLAGSDHWYTYSNALVLHDRRGRNLRRAREALQAKELCAQAGQCTQEGQCTEESAW
jgi:hypothetical protein